MDVIKVKEVFITSGDNVTVLQRVDTCSFWGIGNGLSLKPGGSIWIFTLQLFNCIFMFYAFISECVLFFSNKKASRLYSMTYCTLGEAFVFPEFKTQV